MRRGNGVALRVGIANIHQIVAGRAINRGFEIACYPICRKIARCRDNALQGQGQDGFGGKCRLIGVGGLFGDKVGFAVRVLNDDSGDGGGGPVGIGDQRVVIGPSVKVLQ